MDMELKQRQKVEGLRDDLVILLDEALLAETFGRSIDNLQIADCDEIYILLRRIYENLGILELARTYECADPQTIVEIVKARLQYAKLLNELHPRTNWGQSITNPFGSKVHNLKRHLAILEELDTRNLILSRLDDDNIHQITRTVHDSSASTILAKVGKLLSGFQKPLTN